MSDEILDALRRAFDTWDDEWQGCRQYECHVRETIAFCREHIGPEDSLELHISQLLAAKTRYEFVSYMSELEWAAHFHGRGVSVRFGGEGEADLFVHLEEEETAIEVYTPRGMFHESEDWNETAKRSFLASVKHAFGYDFMPDLSMERRQLAHTCSAHEVGTFMAKALDMIDVRSDERYDMYAIRSSEGIRPKRALVIRTLVGGVSSDDESGIKGLLGGYDTEACVQLSTLVEIVSVKCERECLDLFEVIGVNPEEQQLIERVLAAHYNARGCSIHLGLRFRVFLHRRPGQSVDEPLANEILTALNASKFGLPMWKHRCVVFIGDTPRRSPDRAFPPIVAHLRAPYFERERFKELCYSVASGERIYSFVGYVVSYSQAEGMQRPSIIGSQGGGSSDGMYLSEGLLKKVYQLPKNRGGLFAVTADEGIRIDEFAIQQLLGRLSYSFNPQDLDDARLIVGGQSPQACGLFSRSERAKGVLFGCYGQNRTGGFRIWGYAPNPLHRSAWHDKLAKALGAEHTYEWVIGEDGATFKGKDRSD